MERSELIKEVGIENVNKLDAIIPDLHHTSGASYFISALLEIDLNDDQGPFNIGRFIELDERGYQQMLVGDFNIIDCYYSDYEAGC